MLKYFFKHKFIISLYITSFAPLWFSILLIEFFSVSNAKNINKYTEYIVIITIIIVNIISIIYLRKKIPWFIKNAKEPSQTLKKVIKEKSITSEFLLAYILPLFTFDFTQWKQVILFLVFFITLSFLCLKNKNIYSNIFFELKQYSFYTCEIENNDGIPTTVLIISKNNLLQNVNQKIDFSRIDDSVLLDTMTTL